MIRMFINKERGLITGRGGGGLIELSWYVKFLLLAADFSSVSSEATTGISFCVLSLSPPNASV